jgi:hypothetical protein
MSVDGKEKGRRALTANVRKVCLGILIGNTLNGQKCQYHAHSAVVSQTHAKAEHGTCQIYTSHQMKMETHL